MEFEQLLSRADDQTLQQIVGPPNVKLLNLLDDSLSYPSELRRICLKLHSPAELLRNQATRKQLLTLLPEKTAKDLNQLLGMGGGDPYDRLLDVSLRRNSRQEASLFEFFGVIPPAEEKAANTESTTACVPSYALFDHQRHAERKVQEILRSKKRRVLLHMPTGAGKTRTALHAVVTELRSREPGLVIWLAYSEELCSQAAEEFQQAWSFMGDRTINLYRFWGDNEVPDIGQIRDGFLIAGLSKLYQRTRREYNFLATLADRVSLVIIDEAHQAIAETYQTVLEFLVERDRRTGLLGLTATPGRTWNDPEQDEKLARFFFRQKVTLEADNYHNPIEYLVHEGYLADTKFVTLPYTDGHLGAEHTRSWQNSLEISSQMLQKLAEDEMRNLLIVNTVEGMIQHHPKLLVFTPAVRHARLLATVLNARGERRADFVTASTPKPERERIIAEYKDPNSDLGVLCNFGVLTTGFDAPLTSGAVIARPTKSLVLYSQMVGRAIRGPKAGGNSEAEIRTIADTALPGFGDIADAFNNWEDVWHD